MIIALLLIWLMPILMIIIALESKGNPVFIQKRTGHKGKLFNCLKLRTMVVNDHRDERQSDESDERITSFGYFLRLTSIDEFPQVINVLKGEMSLIGPRPHMLSHTEYYSKRIKSYNLRHQMRPGITGYAQVQGWRGATKQLEAMEKRVAFDLVYVRKWSLKMDFWILWRTIGIIITGLFDGIKYRQKT